MISTASTISVRVQIGKQKPDQLLYQREFNIGYWRTGEVKGDAEIIEIALAGRNHHSWGWRNKEKKLEI